MEGAFHAKYTFNLEMLNGPQSPRDDKALTVLHIFCTEVRGYCHVLLLKTLWKPLLCMGYFIYYLGGDFCDLDPMLQWMAQEGYG